ncbi:MAG TPA: hypothetical protein VK633_14285 [Verrucomicrobiae bacterium]|nr:hypothetical protein [Verrucomicrobiae bacterium]
MNESEFNLLRESSWRRPLTPAEDAQLHAYLAARPEAQPDWESDAALNQLLSELPNVPLASNFTARILSALDQQPPPQAESWWRRPWRAPLFPRLAWATGLICVGMTTLSIYHYQTRKELGRGLDLIAAAMPAEPAILEDFDTIQRWAKGPPIDQDLWMALNQTAP